MKTTIDVKNRKEGEIIKLALDNPEVRAFVIIVGTLWPFSRQTQARVMSFVADHFKEHDND